MWHGKFLLKPRQTKAPNSSQRFKVQASAVNRCDQGIEYPVAEARLRNKPAITHQS
jgi:hypothetical protein